MLTLENSITVLMPLMDDTVSLRTAAKGNYAQG